MSGIKTKTKAPMISRSFLVIFLGLSIFSSGTWALADDHDQMKRDDSHRADVRHVSHHYYRNGRWYRHGWFGFEVAVPVLSAGVYVDSLPPAYTPVVIQGTTYYYGNNTYFRPLPEGGYTVVSISS